MSNPYEDTISQEKPTDNELEKATKRIKDLERSYQEKATEFNKLKRQVAEIEAENNFYKKSINALDLFNAEEKEHLEDLHMNGNHEEYASTLMRYRDNAISRLEKSKQDAVESARQQHLNEKIDKDIETLQRLGFDIGNLPFNIVMQAKSGELDLIEWVKTQNATTKKEEQKEPDLNTVGSHTAHSPKVYGKPENMDEYLKSLF